MEDAKGSWRLQVPGASSAHALSQDWWEHPRDASWLAGDTTQGFTWPGTRSDEGHGKGNPAKCCAGFIPPTLSQGILFTEDDASLEHII